VSAEVGTRATEAPNAVEMSGASDPANIAGSPALASSPDGKRVFKNAALLGAGHSIRLVVGFATTILITDQLGTDYGLLVGAQRYVDFFRLIMLFGLNTILVRGIANRLEDPGTLLGSVIALRALLGCVFVVVAMSSAIASNYLPDQQWLIWVFVAVAWGYVGVETMTGYCEGYERMDRTAPMPVTRSLFMFSGAAIVTWQGWGLIGIASVFLLTQILQFGFILTLSRTLLRGTRVSVSRVRMGALLREGPQYMAIGLAFAALRSINVMILSRFAPTAETAMYGAALNFIDLLFMLPLLAQRAFLPVFSRTMGDSDATSNATGIGTGGVYVFTAVLLPAATGLYVLAESAVALYPSGEFAAAAPVLRILALGIACTSISSVCSTFLTGQGRVSAILRAYAFALPVQVVLCWFGVADGGAVAVARGTVAAQVVLATGIVAAASASGLSIPWAGIARHLIASAIMAAAIAPLSEHFFAIPALVGLLVYPIVLLLICPAGSLERKLAGNLVERLTRRGN